LLKKTLCEKKNLIQKAAVRLGLKPEPETKFEYTSAEAGTEKIYIRLRNTVTSDFKAVPAPYGALGTPGGPSSSSSFLFRAI
jgi:hypothetical protein